MFIVQLEPPHAGGQGDHRYRTAQPCSALGLIEGVRVISTTPLSPATPQLVADCDVLVLCDSADMEHLPLIRSRRALGLVTVYEVNDNFLGVQSWNSTARFYQNPAHQSLIAQLIRLCDGVQFSMPELQKSFGCLNPHQAVFPNHLWEMPPVAPKPEPLTVGWGGSYGHLEDVEWMMPALEWMMETYPQVRLAIMSSPKMKSLFSWVPHDRLDFRPSADLDTYYSFLSQLHIGIAPLLPTEFNRCRSDVKFLEYAAHRCVPLCSDHAPYQFSVIPKQTGLLFRDRDDLKEQLKTVIEDSTLREEVAKGAFDYVAEKRLERIASKQRLTFYRELLGEGGVESKEQRYQTLEESVANVEYSKPQVGSDYRWVHFDTGQKHLYNALLSQFEPAKALEDLAQARAADADSYLSLLYEGSFQKEFQPAVEALKKAIGLRPNACTPHFSLSTHYERKGDFATAQDSLSHFLKLNPDYAPAHEAFGRLLEKQGIPEAALSHYETATKVNSDYRPASHRLLHGYLEQGLLDKANEMAKCGLESVTKTWVDYFLTGRVHYRRREWDAAAVVFEKALELGAEGSNDAPLQEDSPVFSILPFWAKVELERGNRDRAQALLEQLKSFRERGSA